MKRPLLIVALLYTGGILLADHLTIPLPLLFAASVLLAVLALTWSSVRIFLLVPLLIVAGWTNLAWRTRILPPDDLRNVCSHPPQLATLRGTLSASPTEKILVRDDEEIWRTTACLEVESVTFGSKSQSAHGKVVVTTPGILSSNFFSGQRVEVNGILREPRGRLARDLFDARSYFQRKGIFFQLQTESTNAWKLVEPAERALPVTDRFFAWSKKTLALGLPCEDDALRLTWTLMLDWKAPMTEEVQEPFLRAGTFHIFAVDGLRIAILSGIFLGLFRVLQIPRCWCGAMTLPIIWFYVHLTGWPASAIRAAIMMSVIIGGWALQRPSDLINSVFAAAFFILLWDPQQLFQAGFQLSFVVVLCIAVLIEPMRNIQERFLKGDEFLPPELKPRWKRWSERPLRFSLDIFVASCAAWLGSIPLSAYYFHLFTSVSTPANFAVVPLTMLALISGLGSLLTAAWCPPIAILFNHCSWILMKMILWFSQWTADWPKAYFYVSTPSAITIALYYVVLFTVLTGWIFRQRFKLWLVGGIAVLCTAWIVQFISQRNVVSLDILPVNGGHAILVDSFSQKSELLIDCGNESAASSITKPFLRAEGVNRLENFLLSHGDVHQIGGAELIFTNFQPEHVITSAARARSPTYKQVVQQLQSNPQHWQILKAGDAIASWKILHPAADDQFPQADNNTVVLAGTINGASVLLLSDLARSGQNALMQRWPDLSADIVVTGLPNDGEPICSPILDHLKAKIIVVADSDFPATRRASPKLRARLSANHAKVFYTRETGALTFLFHADKWALENAGGKILVESAKLLKQ